MKKNAIFVLIFTVLLSLATTAAQAQTAAAPPKVELRASGVSGKIVTTEFDSKLMARKMPYKIILPTAYETEREARFPVLYLLHGLGGNYKNWIDNTRLVEYAVNRRLVIVTAEGGNGWYSDSATKPADKYESYIAGELIAEIDKNYRTDATRKGRAIAGLSMGGYGALKFGVKHPDKFAFAGSMSGAVSIASWQTAEQMPPNFRPLILATFGDEKNQTKIDNDLFRLFKDVPTDKIAGLPFFYFDCGTEDPLNLLPYNQQLAAILLERKIPHEFRQLPGKHNWQFWNQQIVDVLNISERIFSAK